MCQLVTNINSKSSAIALTIKTKEDSYEVGKAIQGFLGAVVSHHIGEFFNGNQTKGLEDFALNTGMGTSHLERCITTNKTRLTLLAEAKSIKAKADLEATEAREAEDRAKFKKQETVRLEKRKEAQRAEAKSKSMAKAIVSLDEANESVIKGGLNGTSSVEKLEVMATIPKGATMEEVKTVKNKLVALNSITDEVKRNVIKELLAKYPTMQKWDNLEAVFASKIGGLSGNIAHAEVVALINPTTAEVAELRLSIIQAKRAINDEADRTAERDKYGCKLPTEDTKAHKERIAKLDEDSKGERERVAKLKRDEALRALPPLPTEPLNIPKGKMSAKSRDEVINLLGSFGLDEDNIKNLAKALSKKYKL